MSEIPIWTCDSCGGDSYVPIERDGQTICSYCAIARTVERCISCGERAEKDGLCQTCLAVRDSEA